MQVPVSDSCRMDAVPLYTEDRIVNRMKKQLNSDASCKQGLLIRSVVLVIAASSGIGFSGSTFAFSFSNWFSSNKTASAETQATTAAPLLTQTHTSAKPIIIAATNNTSPSQSIAHPLKKHHKKHHKKHIKKRKPITDQTTLEKDNVAQTTPFSSEIKEKNTQNNEISLSGGITISTLNSGNQNVVIDSDPTYGTTNGYNTQPSTRVSSIAGVRYQRLFHLNHDVGLTVGPAFYYANLDAVEGVEHPSINYNSNFSTLNYQYAAETFSLMAEAKAVYEKFLWQPFVTVGVGSSWNKLSDYREWPTDPSSSAIAASSVFGANFSTRLAYEAGLGIQRIFPANELHKIPLSLALSYQYFNFGKGSLSPSAIQNTTEALQANTLDTQTVLLSVGTIF